MFRLAENHDKLISTIRLGNNIASIAVVAIGTLLFLRLYGDIGTMITAGVIPIVDLIFGEITP